jgi:hypothetical protein
VIPHLHTGGSHARQDILGSVGITADDDQVSKLINEDGGEMVAMGQPRIKHRFQLS